MSCGVLSQFKLTGVLLKILWKLLNDNAWYFYKIELGAVQGCGVVGYKTTSVFVTLKHDSGCEDMDNLCQSSYTASLL